MIGLGFPFCKAITSNKNNKKQQHPIGKRPKVEIWLKWLPWYGFPLCNSKTTSNRKILLKWLPRHGIPVCQIDCWYYNGGETQTSSNHESFPCIWKPVVWIWTRLPVIITQTKVQSTLEDQRYNAPCDSFFYGAVTNASDQQKGTVETLIWDQSLWQMYKQTDYDAQLFAKKVLI